MNRLPRTSRTSGRFFPPLILGVALMLSLVFAASAFAAVTVIDIPDSTYLASTTRIDFSGVPEGTAVDHVADSQLAVSFPGMLKFTTPNDIEPYATSWGYPGLVESALDVPYVTKYGPVEFTLSQPLRTFGFEAYNGMTGAANITVTFLSATSETIATITKYVGFDGSSWDARLFAITSDIPISGVRVATSSDRSVGYGQFRYALQPTMAEEAAELREFAETAAASGDLLGVGNARSAPRKLSAFLEMLATAEKLVEQKMYPEALSLLESAYGLCDGLKKPADNVTGPACAGVATRSLALIERLRAEMP